MKHEKCNFIEAIQKIAEIIGVQLEYEEIVDQKKYEAEKALRDQMDAALQFSTSKHITTICGMCQKIIQ
jgi:DNA primase